MNEREAFEKWYSSMWVERLDRDKHGQYKSVKVRSSWFAWQASANREGYKLLPVVDTDAMWSAGRAIIDENGYCTDASDVYKAMIGAVDDKTT